MNVNNNTELNSIQNKLEFKGTQKSIDNATQKIFGQDIFRRDSSDSKNQIFKLGETSQEDIMDAVSNNPSEFVRGALVALGNTATGTDLSELNEEGYDTEKDKVETVVTVTDKIQIYLATHCEDFEATADISKEELEAVSGSSQTAAALAKKFQENNIPLTKDNMEESLEALEIASQLKPLSDGASKYIINNGLAPTIENVYKAEYSGLGIEGGTYGAGYFSEGSGYYGKTSDEFNWNGLNEQMGKVIESAGLEVNEETMSDAKKLIENHIPLTKDTLSQYEALKNLSLPTSEEDTMESIVQALNAGRRPSQALLTGEGSFAQRAEEACQVIEKTTDENLKQVVDRNLPLTIANLKAAQEESTATGVQANSQTVSTQTTAASAANTQASNTTAGVQVTEENIALITARRQLEEIRLQMTSEANYRLLKQGISIETTDLQTLINELKNAEDAYYKQLLSQGDVEETQENINSLKEISTKIADIKYVPNTVIGSVVSGETPNTINGIHAKGTSLKATYDAANQSYEALMTKPRSDMGDKISKAFQNVDDILTDMGLDTTESNQRAVRILGYNSMEITTDNINAVKAADAAVNETISNLTPKVVLNMIREGINPLDMNIDELNNQISDMKNQLGEDNTQEKYSEFLWRMEQNDEITKQERDSFIGIYRLLNNVEKTDGGVVGALVNQNASITLSNLLTGVRSSQNKGIDVKVDNNFGELESLTFQSTSISDQINTAFGGNSAADQGQTKQQEESTTYHNNLVDKALREIAPDKLTQVFEKGTITDMPLEQFVDKLVEARADGEITKQFYKEQLATIQKASQVESSVIEMLSDFKQPVTISNILAAEAMMSKRGSMFKNLLNDQEESTELTEAMDKIADSLTSKEDMTAAYEEFENAAISVVNEQTEKDGVTSLDLKELKLLRNEIRLTTNLSREEKYEIPLQIGDEITSMNLTVIRGTKEGQVTVTMENEAVGKAAAQFTLKGSSVTGYIAVDNEEGLELLKQNGEEWQAQLAASGLEADKIDYITSKSLDINKWKDGQEKSGEDTGISTKDLYSVARAFVVSMQKTAVS
ncbi:DUF6240 domain-containing protein [Konateibacter massiliensis]|uniref:DUF6240 domain-containing protein n=1 Tax=Konateibacter massiliensis TaxID=2002841 RepID=UPI000C156399|nr:DUF6240 domain-containing protein [Konateibacter massiliensis]